jgi:hypothetical protein
MLDDELLGLTMDTQWSQPRKTIEGRVMGSTAFMPGPMMLEFVFNSIYLLKELDQVWFAALGADYVRKRFTHPIVPCLQSSSGHRMVMLSDKRAALAAHVAI